MKFQVYLSDNFWLKCSSQIYFYQCSAHLKSYTEIPNNFYLMGRDREWKWNIEEKEERKKKKRERYKRPFSHPWFRFHGPQFGKKLKHSKLEFCTKGTSYSLVSPFVKLVLENFLFSQLLFLCWQQTTSYMS